MRNTKLKKRKSTRNGKTVLTILALVSLMLGALTACNDNAATPSAMCGFVIGDGQNGHDTKLHRVVYPDQNPNLKSSEDIKYVPCNTRNYIINDGTEKNANGDLVGDRHTLTKAYTSTGTPVWVWSSSSWTLNQDPAALSNFYQFCFKYDCATSDSKASGANFASKGWNGMLGENFGPATDQVALLSVQTVDDTVWQKHDATKYAGIATAMSDNFQKVMQNKTGYDTDLFCGAGSAWKDPANPGSKDNTFNCKKVRFEVERVEAVNDTQANAAVQASIADQQKDTNTKRAAAAQELYGSETNYWLGVMDAINACKAAGSSCVLSIGGNGAPAVSVPAAGGK
ncbi:MAG: hypothetical protein JWN38_815 [Candidatus Saccharibacteria bacterium]|nr:hypothetical protein [Candidatus Saccharibacteria bacterium]